MLKIDNVRLLPLDDEIYKKESKIFLDLDGVFDI